MRLAMTAMVLVTVCTLIGIFAIPALSVMFQAIRKNCDLRSGRYRRLRRLAKAT
jgi:hypothetical protein